MRWRDEVAHTAATLGLRNLTILHVGPEVAPHEFEGLPEDPDAYVSSDADNITPIGASALRTVNTATPLTTLLMGPDEAAGYCVGRVTTGSDARPQVGGGKAIGSGDDDDTSDLDVERLKVSSLVDQLKAKAAELEKKLAAQPL